MYDKFLFVLCFPWKLQFSRLFIWDLIEQDVRSCYWTVMTGVVRISPSSGLKNRVILPHWKRSQLVELIRYSCMFGIKTSRNSLGNQKMSAWTDTDKIHIVVQGWVNSCFEPRRGWFSHVFRIAELHRFLKPWHKWSFQTKVWTTLWNLWLDILL